MGAPPPINPLQNILRYIGYCDGESYIDRVASGRDYADYKTQQFQYIGNRDAINRAILNQVFQQQVTQRPVLQPAPIIQRVLVQPILNFVQAFAQAGQGILNNVLAQLPQAFTQGLQGMFTRGSAVLQNAMTRVMSFFFANKRFRDTEQDNREHDDFSTTDLFTKAYVDPSQAGAQGSKQ